jgi:hypothetical protein
MRALASVRTSTVRIYVHTETSAALHELNLINTYDLHVFCTRMSCVVVPALRCTHVHVFLLLQCINFLALHPLI